MITRALAAVLLLAAAAVAETEGPRAHFRVELGGETTRVVSGWFEGPGGDGYLYGHVVLDLDGDGRPETRRELPRTQWYAGPNEVRSFLQAAFDVDHDGWTWHLTFDQLHDPGLRCEENGRLSTTVSWMVTKGDASVHFRGGGAGAWLSARRAAEEPPVKVGAPFRFTIASRTEGPQALVDVALLDRGGSKLSQASVGKSDRAPFLGLARDGVPVLGHDVEYG
jgi:hypothetical protein